MVQIHEICILYSTWFEDNGMHKRWPVVIVSNDLCKKTIERDNKKIKPLYVIVFEQIQNVQVQNYWSTTEAKTCFIFLFFNDWLKYRDHVFLLT